MTFDNINKDWVVVGKIQKTYGTKGLVKIISYCDKPNSIFNYESGTRAFLTLGQGNINELLESLLPNTRLILEPRIIGFSIGLQYLNGKLNKAIDKNKSDTVKAVEKVTSTFIENN